MNNCYKIMTVLLRKAALVNRQERVWRQAFQGGWQRAQAICDYAHDRIEFGYHHARGYRTASEGHDERRGVCRDFAHLAVTLSRCMNIPARYCTGYLGDIGVPVDPAPMDFSAWYEVFLVDAGSPWTRGTIIPGSAAS
jgi:transglutaminase-like putative cysteine protease